MSTLYDYYNSIGKPLPTVNDRQGVASQAGISGYSGTAQQNGTLLAFLQKNGNSGQTAPSTSQGSTPPSSTPVATPTTNPSPTVATAYKNVNTPDLPDYQTAGNTFKQAAEQPIDENAIRSNSISMFQGQLDALKQVYQQQLAKTKLEGEGRLGSGRATQARSGLLGSDFADTQNNTIQGYNTGIENDVTANYNNQINSIIGQANKISLSDIADRKAAKEQGAKNYLDFLGNADQRKVSNLTSLGKLLISQGIKDISEINPSDLQTLASKYQTTPDQIGQYFAQAKVEQAKAYKDSLITTSTFGNLYDPASGKVLLDGAGSKNDYQDTNSARTSFYALQKQYPDAPLQYNPSKSWEENLNNAQNLVSTGSQYFGSKLNNTKVTYDAFGNQTFYNAKAPLNGAHAPAGGGGNVPSSGFSTTNGTVSGAQAGTNLLPPKARNAVLVDQGKQAANTDRAILAADKNFGLLMSTLKGKGINNFESPLANQWNNLVQKKLVGSGDLAVFNTGIQTLQTEYSQILGRGGQVTDNVRAEAGRLIDGTYSMKDLQGVYDYIKKEGANVNQSYNEEINKVQGKNTIPSSSNNPLGI